MGSEPKCISFKRHFGSTFPICMPKFLASKLGKLNRSGDDFDGGRRVMNSTRPRAKLWSK